MSIFNASGLKKAILFSSKGGDSSLGDQLDDDGKTAISLGAGAGLLVGAGAALTRLLGG